MKEPDDTNPTDHIDAVVASLGIIPEGAQATVRTINLPDGGRVDSFTWNSGTALGRGTKCRLYRPEG